MCFLSPVPTSAPMSPHPTILHCSKVTIKLVQSLLNCSEVVVLCRQMSTLCYFMLRFSAVDNILSINQTLWVCFVLSSLITPCEPTLRDISCLEMKKMCVSVHANKRISAVFWGLGWLPQYFRVDTQWFTTMTDLSKEYILQKCEECSINQ